MPPRPKRRKIVTSGDNAQGVCPTLFINIRSYNGKQYTCELVNLDGDTWRICGVGAKVGVVATATKFAKFSGLPVYMDGERFDGRKPMLMKGNPGG